MIDNDPIPVRLPYHDESMSFSNQSLFAEEKTMGQMISHSCEQDLEFIFSTAEHFILETGVCDSYPVVKLNIHVSFDGCDDLRFAVGVYKHVLGIVSYSGTTFDERREDELKMLQTIKPMLEKSACPENVLNLLNLYIHNLKGDIARASAD